ncbi:MAG: hypothetical protein IKV80_08415 [Bacteroidales bacterium]|nr:hypothetical protein [Bacteroidales bacterium]
MTVTLEELKQKYTELGAMIRSFEEREEAEFPKNGDTYYYIVADGIIVPSTFETTDYDINIVESGNAFRTKEEAEFEREFRKVKREMERCGGVWKTKRGKETAYGLKLLNGELHIEDWRTDDTLPVFWFSTEEAAQKAIDTIGEERLLKYWFCVEVEA